MSSDPEGPYADGSRGLASTQLRRALREMIRRKAPPADVEDLVQATLTDALASPRVPQDSDELRRWVFAIARNKIVDHHRRSGRESPQELPEIEAAGAPHSAHDLMRWAEGAIPEGEHAQETLDWMLREGQGEKLESIAEEASVPAPQVRKRVSRLRQHLRERWAIELSAALLLTAAALGAFSYWRERPMPLPIAQDEPSSMVPQISRLDKARELREEAFLQCRQGRWQACLDGLEKAATLDRAGDDDAEVKRMRGLASDGLAPVVPPAPSSTEAPTRPLPKTILKPSPKATGTAHGSLGFGSSDESIAPSRAPKKNSK
jgi:RNA polymerase sigma factor (sigma-70 family)